MPDPIFTPNVAETLSPSLNLDESKEINPQAREILSGQGPMSQFEKVEPNYVDAGGAKKIDLNARQAIGGFQSPMSAFEKVPARSLPGFEKADDLDVKTVEELDADRTNFNPVSYLEANPDVFSSPARGKKLLDVYRKRSEEGLKAAEVAKRIFSKETGDVISNIPGGIKRFGERAIDVTVQPISNIVLGALTGDLFNKQSRDALFNETRKVIRKGTAEVSAGAESASVGLVDLSRQGLRKSDAAYTPVPLSAMGEGATQVPIPLKKPKTDQELLREISDDVAFRQNAGEILRGEGEAAKKMGLDKETLAKQGITLDEKAIEQLSLVDPVTMVATGGAFKLVGLGGKVLGTARTLAAAQEATAKLAELAKYSIGKGIQYSGTATKFVGTTLQGSGKTAALLTGIGASVRGAGPVESLATAAAAKTVGPATRFIGAQAEHFGKAIAGEVPVSATAQKVIDYAKIPGRAAGVITKGAFTGIAAAAPFAVLADDDATAAALLGAGGALGAAGGAGAGAFRVVKTVVAREYFGQNRPAIENVPSPGYGKEPVLDGKHSEQIKKFSVQDASELNGFREGLRQQGGEFYALDRASWRKEMERVFPDISPEQMDIYENHSAFFDEAKTKEGRHVVYLNADATGLRHDAGHIFDSVLSPEKRAELRKAVTDTFGQKSIDDFKETYQGRVGNKISDKAALDEFIAEQFNALFHNVPLSEMNAPRSLLKKFVDVAAEAAETLGIDLTAGTTTPTLGAPVSIGIRKLFQNAAGDVMRANIEGVPATNIAPLPPTPPPAPAGPGPVAPPTNIVPLVPPPANVVPLVPPAPAPAGRNIRVTPEQTGAFTSTPAPASPDARAAAAARAAETGVDYARAEAKKDDGSPTSRIIEQISDTMESGRPVVAIEHLGITSESTPAAPLGKGARVREQEAGYAALEAAQLDVRQNAPSEIVTQHSKNFVPLRWDAQGGSPTLIAMSLDKVISNAMRVANWSKDPRIKALMEYYPTENGKFTADGWREVVADAQAYSENQANGRKGDGGRLEVPEAGLSIPVENPTYTPKPLTPERADFQNLLQGLHTEKTSRSPKGNIPGNVKGQLLAEANRRSVELPANIPTTRAGKQAFIEFPPRVVQEMNPLRNALARLGVETRELLPVTERIRAKDIVSATPRPDVAYQAPVTDIIRGGFAPAPTEFRQKNLGGRTVEEFGEYILKASPEEWKAATSNMTGGLTGGAWNLGLGLKDSADLVVLQSLKTKASALAKEAMTAGDFDKAYQHVAQSQFFTEAYQAATNTGSAKAAFASDKMGFSVAKSPFPAETTTTGTTSGPSGDATRFQPAEELSVGETELRPELRVLPASPGGRPPTEPPTFRPPPVAAGVAKKDEEAPRFAPAPSKEIQDLAKSYAADAGLPYVPKGGYAEVKPELAKKLAEFYDKAKSDPTNPEVAASYEALIRETEEQGKAILAAGYNIEPWEGAGEPYKSSDEAISDVRDNKHLFFRKTSGAFGSGNESAGNPMLAESAIVPGQTVNDVFRWVHDFFGHSKEGFQFGPRGEFNAWRAHSEMYSPDAQGALAAETLAQNSWVNYGPHLEGKNIPLAERPFAEQKNVVVPKALIDEATFAPRTEAGRKLEEGGYKIVASGEMGIRRVSVVKDGDEFAAIQSVQRSPKKAEIAMVQKYKGAPKGIGEVLYRELGSQLRDDGVTLVEGQVIAPEPLAIRKKIFGDFARLDVNGEPATYAEALAATERVKNRTETSMDVVEPVSTISAATRFAPGRRDPQGRPLNKEGEIDYARWQAEGIAARKKQRAESDKTPSIKEVGPLVKETEPKSSTGWILPDKKFVPLDTNFHETYLAENAKTLNEKFGTKFSSVESSVDDRLAAVNAGFVRFRNYNGRLSVEANAAKWRSLKPKVRETLQDRESSFDSLTISLLNNKGQEVDSTSAVRLHELSGPQRLEAIDGAVDDLRVPGQ